MHHLNAILCRSGGAWASFPNLAPPSSTVPLQGRLYQNTKLQWTTLARLQVQAFLWIVPMLPMPEVGGPALPAMFCPPRVRHQQHCTKPACPDQPSVKNPGACKVAMLAMYLYHASHAVCDGCGWSAWIETALQLPPPLHATEPGFLPLYSLSNNTDNSKCLTTNNYQVEAPLPTNVPSPARSKACHHGLHAACHFVRVLPSLHVKQPKLQKHRPHKHMCKGPRLQTRQRPSQRRTNHTSPKVHRPPQLHQNAEVLLLLLPRLRRQMF